MILRLATMDDAKHLFDWRNDPATRAASFNVGELDFPTHVSWLANSLSMANRKIFIAELDGAPVGTVRMDMSNGITELSWTTSPQCRRQGIGTHMVRLAVEQLDTPVRAEIKEGNEGSVKIAEAAGLTLRSKSHGVLHYHRD